MDVLRLVTNAAVEVFCLDYSLEGKDQALGIMTYNRDMTSNFDFIFDSDTICIAVEEKHSIEGSLIFINKSLFGKYYFVYNNRLFLKHHNSGEFYLLGEITRCSGNLEEIERMTNSDLKLLLELKF